MFDTHPTAVKGALECKKNTEKLAAHVGGEFGRNPATAAAAVRDRVRLDTDLPDDPGDDASKAKMFIWENKYRTASKLARTWNDSNLKIYNLVLRQCTTEMVTALKGSTEWEKTKRKHHCVGILNLIYDYANHQDGGSPDIA